jgi:hypothetical protein
MRGSLFALLLLISAVASAADSPVDGPYVTLGDHAAWVARWVSADKTAHSKRVEIGSSFEVAGVGDLPAFQVTLRAPGKSAPDEVALAPGTPLFVMADTHGEFEIAVALLQKQHVIDSRLRWSFGKGHLAVLGDVFDRGANQTEILWLLYELEEEARRAGGGVHFVLGNHEAMAVGGDTRYLNPKYAEVASRLGAPSYASLFDASTLLGKWLRTKAAVVKVGGYLCMHGGLSREAVDRKLTLKQINTDIRAELGQLQPQGFVYANSGPLWYRGYFPDEAQKGGFVVATSSDIAAVLSFYDAKAIFVGHTRVDTVTPLFAGRVVAVQVYPHRDAANGAPILEGLLVKEGRFYRAHADGKVEPLGQ